MSEQHRISDEPFQAGEDEISFVNVTRPDDYHRFITRMRWLGFSDVELEELLRDFPAFREAFNQIQQHCGGI